VSFLLLNTAPDRGETVIMDLMKAYDQISGISSLYVFLHVSDVVLHLSDGMSHLMVHGVNPTKQGCV
jgi:hypothetical protein